MDKISLLDEWKKNKLKKKWMDDFMESFYIVKKKIVEVMREELK